MTEAPLTPITPWVDAAVAATSDVAHTALGCQFSPLDAMPTEPLVTPFGAFVPLLSSGTILQLGILAERRDCERLSRTLLGMAEDEVFSAETDVADAIAELANMIGGGVKTRMSEHTPGLVLGLPLCISGSFMSGAAECGLSEVQLGTVRARVVVIRSLR